MEQIMKKFIKLAVAVSAALATQYASAGVMLYGDGGSINMPGVPSFQVASVYENAVTSVGQELKGYGEITQINGSSIDTLCSGCELTFTFDSYIVDSISSSAATFSGGKVNVYLGFGGNNDFNPFSSGSSAADVAAASNGALFLTLTGHAIDGSGNTLASTVFSGDLLGLAFTFFGGGLWDVDMAGAGLANANFDTDSISAAFGGNADFAFDTSGRTTGVPHPDECTRLAGASCVAGSADIRGAVIPEPGTLALAGLGLLGLGFGSKRRKIAAC